jgi:serine/threonine protein kinase
MRASGDEFHVICGKCGAPLQHIGQFAEQCVACLLKLLWDEEEIPTARVEQFDHYQVATRPDGTLVELGRGAMGITFKAFDTVLGNDVALKVIDARIADHPEARERFLREARAAARLRHPNVASVFYYGTRKTDGQCFYAMELVEGETLEARLRRGGRLPPAVALEVISQVARALVAIEVQGLVHRDLKPANLMLVEGPELTIKVIDFGLAKAAATAGSDITHGGFVGTPSFASPEQFNDTSVDVRSDLYSLGITLWEMLSGQTPFRGTPVEVMHQHQHAPLPLDLLKAVPQPIVFLLKMLLEKDPGQRFQNPAEFLNAISTVAGAIDARRRITRQSLRKTPLTASRRGTRKPPGPLAPKRISIARLPVTGTNVFGREEDIAFLDHSWSDQAANVVSIVAWAGVGKSTLVNHWLRRMAIDHYRSAELIFGWSFYRQGSSGETASAVEFLDAALTWFGDPDLQLGTAWEKGERLAELVGQRRTLLILDGLEPLQNPPGPQEGRLREPSLQALLRELAAFNRGLCVITTRTPIADIADHESTSALRRDLDHLSSDGGARLLRALGVEGDEEKLRSASDEFDGHCLALTLLGSYLTDAYGGDIRCREEVSKRLSHDVRQGAHARKVMESYETWFGEGPEISVLRILGLFDRPVDQEALGALLKSPAIPGLTVPLPDVGSTEWRTILAKLRRARLLAGEDPHNPGHLDTHPLVRGHFGEQLRIQQPEAWIECHRRLYDFYRALAPQMPESFREMEPLFLAVISGCHASLFRAALHEVYLPRIQRGNASFAAKVLGATGPLLSALIHFFEDENCAHQVKVGVDEQSLTPEDQLFILMQAAQYLTTARGLAASEVRICYERAESLSHSVDSSAVRYVALLGQWRHTIVTSRLSTAKLAAERVYVFVQKQSDPALMIGGYMAMAAILYCLGDLEAGQQYTRRSIQIWHSGAVRFAPEEVDVPVVTCLCYEAIFQWNFGDITSCHEALAEAISVAKELNDMHAFAVALSWAAAVAQLERIPAEVERLASEMIELSTRHNFVHFRTIGTVLRGWARSASGDTAEGISWIERGIRDFRAGGTLLYLPYHLTLKAEALHLANRTSEALEAINEAKAVAESIELRYSISTIHRLRGVFLANLGEEETEIEVTFRAAIGAAREQKSVSLAKRAEASYAEYRRQKASASEGRGFRLPLW